MRLGADLPRVRAPPDPAKLWHMAQLTRKISPPRAMLPPAGSVTELSGIAGPGARDATYAARSETCWGLNRLARGWIWTLGPAAGIRPVPTWKSTAAAPTP